MRTFSKAVVKVVGGLFVLSIFLLSLVLTLLAFIAKGVLWLDAHKHSKFHLD